MPNTVPDWISYDPNTDVLTIHGVRYAQGVFAGLGLGPTGRLLKIIERKDGVVTLQSIDQDVKEPV